MRNRIHRFSLKNIYSSRGGDNSRHLKFFHKVYAAKHRFLCLTLAILILVPVFGALIPPGHAAAADPTNPNFAFYVPNSGSFLSQLKNAVDNDTITDGSFDQTAVYATGRIFGSKQQTMQIETGETGCAQAAADDLSGSCLDEAHFGGAPMSLGGNKKLFVYDTSYTCDTGIGLDSTSGSSNPNDHYDVTFAVTLSLGDTLFKSDGSLNSQVVMHWAGFTTIQHYVKEQTDVARPAPTNTNSADLPQGCHPSIDGIYIGSNDTTGLDGENVNQNIKVVSTLPAGAIAPSGGGAGGGGAGGLTTSCNLGSYLSNLSLGSILNAINPLNWLLCGIIQGMGSIVQSLDSAINSWLVVGTNGDTSTDNPGAIFAYDGNQCAQPVSGGGTACADYYGAWAAFRDLALGLLAILCLGIIIAQALGMEILDAYTIRKMLPRVVAGAIILTISWPLMRFFVTLSNDLGYGVKSMLYTPFAGISDNINTSNFFVDLTGALAGLALGFFGLLSFLGTAALAVLVAFLTLVFRQIAIILLIILSPIAIIAYALPNTQRVYKFWWESFSKMLLMFPLIVAFITMGHIFSALSSQNTGSSGPVNGTYQLIAVIAYFAPYFMIPFTFRFAGGIMSGVGNAINSNGLINGARGGLSKFRSNQFKHNMADLQSGDRLKGTSIPVYGKFAKRFNSATRGAANLPNAGYNPARMAQRMRTAESTRSTSAAMDALQNNEKGKAIYADDDLVEVALMYDNDKDREKALRDRGLEPERATQGVAAIRAFERSVDHNTFDKTLLIAAGGTSSGLMEKRDKDGNLLNEEFSGSGQFRNFLNKKLGNDRQGAIAVLGAFRQQSESKGRWDQVGGSFTEDALLLEENNKVARSGSQVDVAQWTKQVSRNALDGQSRAKLLSGHNRSLQVLAPEMLTELTEASTGRNSAGEIDTDWTPTAGVEQYAFMASALDYSSSAAPEMARHIKQQLEQKVDFSKMDGRMIERIRKVKASDGRPVIETHNEDGSLRTDVTQADIMEALRKDNEFAEYRREWGRGSEAEEAARRAGPPGTS